MEQLITQAIEVLLKQGPLAIVLSAAVFFLWRENKALHERLFKLLEGIANIKEDGK